MMMMMMMMIVKKIREAEEWLRIVWGIVYSLGGFVSFFLSVVLSQSHVTTTTIICCVEDG